MNAVSCGSQWQLHPEYAGAKLIPGRSKGFALVASPGVLCPAGALPNIHPPPLFFSHLYKMPPPQSPRRLAVLLKLALSSGTDVTPGLKAGLRENSSEKNHGVVGASATADRAPVNSIAFQGVRHGGRPYDGFNRMETSSEGRVQTKGGGKFSGHRSASATCSEIMFVKSIPGAPNFTPRGAFLQWAVFAAVTSREGTT